MDEFIRKIEKVTTQQLEGFGSFLQQKLDLLYSQEVIWNDEESKSSFLKSVDSIECSIEMVENELQKRMSEASFPSFNKEAYYDSIQFLESLRHDVLTDQSRLEEVISNYRVLYASAERNTSRTIPVDSSLQLLYAFPLDSFYSINADTITKHQVKFRLANHSEFYILTLTLNNEQQTIKVEESQEFKGNELNLLNQILSQSDKVNSYLCTVHAKYRAMGSCKERFLNVFGSEFANLFVESN